MAERTPPQEILKVPTWSTPQVRTELPGPKSRALFDRFDRVDSRTLLDHANVPFVEALL